MTTMLLIRIHMTRLNLFEQFYRFMFKRPEAFQFCTFVYMDSMIFIVALMKGNNGAIAAT
jgi:hypothetical protein